LTSRRFLALAIALLLVTNLSGANAVAQEAESYDWSAAGKIAVQDGGRVKPLDTFARELLATVYGHAKYQGQNPVQTFFLWMSDGEHWAEQPIVYLPKSDLRTRIGLAESSGNYFSVKEIHNLQLLQSLAMEAMAAEQAGEKLSFAQGKGNELLNRVGMLSAVFSHEHPLWVPTPDGDASSTWLPMPHLLAMMEDTSREAPLSEPMQTLGLAFAGLFNSVRDQRPDVFNASAKLFDAMQRELLQNQSQTLASLDWESLYHRFEPFFWAQVLLALGFGAYLLSLKASLSRLKIAGLISLVLGLVLYTTGMGFRAFISGRAPWSNMYESLLAIGWALVLIAVIYELIKRERYYGMVACILGTMILGVAQFASLDRGINPLVPALQSYWLNYHVIITLSSYSCFAIAMGLGHGVLIAAIRNRGVVTSTVTKLASANLRIIQLGSLLLVTGILLGAVWANSSWGRFWGWDPKETWALICWFVYIAVLHGRSAGWLGWRRLAITSVALFPVVIMTYYGVNYYLSGLHSYGAGSSPGIPWQIYLYIAAEAAFLIWAITKLPQVTPPGPEVPASALKKQPALESSEIS
jgi:cytochrome c-type biogenesis protein CcsB